MSRGSAPHSGAQDIDSLRCPDIVHFVGPLSPVVLSYLQPASRALSAAGFKQLIIAVGSPPRVFDEDAFGQGTVVEFIESRSRLNRWGGGLSRLAAALQPSPPAGVHLHGFIPFVLGGISLRREGYAGRIYYSPHGSRVHSRLGRIGALAYAVTAPLIRGSSFLIIGDSAGDSLDAIPERRTVEPVPTPIPQECFQIEHIEAPEALVLGGSAEATSRHINAFCQWSIMLPRVTSSGVKIRFCWTGPANPDHEAVLKAAEIERIAPIDFQARLELLSMAWIYLAPVASRGYPVYLAEAMACGVTCVVDDSPAHRNIVVDGIDGVVFNNPSDGISILIDLLESSEARRRLGRESARRMRETRSSRLFERAVLPLFEPISPLGNKAPTART